MMSTYDDDCHHVNVSNEYSIMNIVIFLLETGFFRNLVFR